MGVCVIFASLRETAIAKSCRHVEVRTAEGCAWTIAQTFFHSKTKSAPTSTLALAMQRSYHQTTS